MGMLHRRRVVLSLFVSAVLGSSLALPSFASGAAELTLQSDEGDKVTYDLGENRSKRVLSLIFSSSEPLSSPPSVVVSDAKAEGGELFPGSLTAAAEVVGQELVRVNVTVEPGNISTGTYASQVLLRGGGVNGTKASLVVEFDRSPSEFAALLLALLALAIGVFLGWLLKWLSTTGAKLRLLTTRYELLMSSFDGDEWTPAALKTTLSEVRVWLAQGEVEKAEEKLKTIEEKAEAILAAMRTLGLLKGRIDEEVSRVEGMDSLDLPAEAKLKEVLAAERRRLQQLRDGTYPDPDAEAEKRAREERAAEIEEFDAFLAEYADTSKRDGKWDEALTKYHQGDYAGAKEKWSAEERVAVVAPSIEPETPSANPGPLEKAKWFATRNAPTLVGVLVALGIVIVGLQTVFKPESMFLENNFRDFTTLVAWGFGSALTGLTTTELASKVLPKP